MRENRVRSLALDFKAMARTRGESHRCRIVSCGFTVAHSEFSGQNSVTGIFDLALAASVLRSPLPVVVVFYSGRNLTHDSGLVNVGGPPSTPPTLSYAV